MNTRAGTFDATGFYDALDAIRIARDLSWRDVARSAGISASTLTRMAQEKRPDVDSLAALCAWSGLKADDYIETVHHRPQAESVAAITSLLRSDRNLSPESVARLSEIISVTYRHMKKSSRKDS
jgi:transcriptional regulator with XRE-family HTH domain